jgi:opacity protein-like surface antigen
MSVRTGINYSQINEKFTLVQGNLVQVTYIINAAGDTTGSYITTGTRYKTTYNKFKTIDVPLLIGYEMGNGRFHANVSAGIIINAYSWQKGEVLDTSYNPVSITTGKGASPYQFKTNIGLGFTAGIGMYYKLNEKLHVVAEPYFRYNLSPMSKEKLTLTQKYNTAGLRLGLRLDLH